MRLQGKHSAGRGASQSEGLASETRGDFQEAARRTMCLGTGCEVMMHEVREETAARERVCPCRPQKQLHVTACR